MGKKIYRLDEVYGVSRSIPLNYATRPTVDDAFIASLSQDRHIVIYGSSKQGKTSLRKHSLLEEDYVVITCSNRWRKLGSVHTAILKAAGYTVQQSTSKTADGSFKVKAAVEAEGGIPFLAKAKGQGEVETVRGHRTEITSSELELDPDDVNDIIEALRSIHFNKFIVLEDFHYLPDETQVDFSVALKAFHEHSDFTFVVVGVWLDENRLIQHNGDLTDRVSTVNADEWNRESLDEVIREGERLLNIQFAPDFRTDLLNECFDSVSLVQVSCHAACSDSGVTSTQRERKIVGSGLSADDIIKGAVDRQSARYNAFIQKFADGFQDTELQMYRWLLLPVLISDSQDLEKGLRYSVLNRTISAFHPKGAINPGNVTQSLQSTASLQVKHDIKPIILDYDRSTNRLNVVDKGFLIWIGHQDRASLLMLADLPDNPDYELKQ